MQQGGRCQYTDCVGVADPAGGAAGAPGKGEPGIRVLLGEQAKSSTAACPPLPSQPIDALLRPCFLAAATHVQVGIHSDMIKRSNDKLSQQRLDQLKEAALRPEALALLTGLDFSRDMGIR